MAMDAPPGFRGAFAELRRMHNELCANFLLQTPIIEGLLLQAHQAEVARLQHAAPGTFTANGEAHGAELAKLPHVAAGKADLPGVSEEIPCERQPVVDVLMTYAESDFSRCSSPKSAALDRWAKLLEGLSLPEEARNRLKAKTRTQKFKLRPFWMVNSGRRSGQCSVFSQTPTGLTTRDRFQHRGLRVGSTVKSKESFLQPLTIHPDNRLSVAHYVLQFILIFIDVVDFPMTVFHSGQTLLTQVMVFVSAIFWTWDVIMSFLQGFHSPTGTVEMRPAHIAYHYLRGWFFFDLLVLAFDWLSFTLFVLDEADNRDTRIVRATKIGKAQRILRGVRILRLAKVSEKLRVFFTGNEADWIIVIWRISSLLSAIIIINHYIACLWFFISSGISSQHTWIREQMLENASIFDEYFYSLHWSLTQFTPCTNDIAPANGVERFFACFVVLFALVVFSTFLSSLTSAVMQIKRLNDERYNETGLIRRFMLAKKVPLTVAHQVWHYYRNHYRAHSRIVQMSDVGFFGTLPKSLHRTLNSHVYIPCLVKHPVVQELVEAPPHPLGAALCEIVTTLVPASGHDVFLEGEPATHMYYFVGGVGTYTFYGEDKRILPPDYLAEAALWLSDWQHLGHLTVADNSCELLLLGAAPFIACIEEEAAPSTIKSLRKYASVFAQHQEDIEVNAGSGGSMWAEMSKFPCAFAADDGARWFSDLPLDEAIQVDLRARAFQTNRPFQSGHSFQSIGTERTEASSHASIKTRYFPSKKTIFQMKDRMMSRMFGHTPSMSSQASSTEVTSQASSTEDDAHDYRQSVDF